MIQETNDHQIPIDYSDRTVAFIDILGFESMISQLSQNPVLHKKIHQALTEIGHYKSYSEQGNTAQSDLEVSVFSDSIVISKPDRDVRSVIHTIVHLQAQMLRLGILLRGGISAGRSVHKDGLLYGEGVLAAYHLESKVAVYPRIVLDSELLGHVPLGFRTAFLKQDTDNLWFIDPFSVGIPSGNDEALLEDGYDPHEESLKELALKIDSELAELNDPRKVEKWKWLKIQHEAAIEEFYKLGKPRFWHMWSEAERKKLKFSQVLNS